MPGDSPGNPQLIKQVRIIGARVFYHARVKQFL